MCKQINSFKNKITPKLCEEEMFLLRRNTWNHLTENMSSGSLKNVINKFCLQIIYIMYREDLALNNPQ